LARIQNRHRQTLAAPPGSAYLRASPSTSSPFQRNRRHKTVRPQGQHRTARVAENPFSGITNEESGQPGAAYGARNQHINLAHSDLLDNDLASIAPHKVLAEPDSLQVDIMHQSAGAGFIPLIHFLAQLANLLLAHAGTHFQIAPSVQGPDLHPA